MRIILGTPEGYKTTWLLSIVYAIIEKAWKDREELIKAKEMETDDPYPYAVYITSKRKLNENQLVFGTYSEVTIDVLKNIKMKYIDSFEWLVEYLMDFHLLQHIPSIVVIDGFELYWTGSCDLKLSQITSGNKKIKVDYLINCIKHLEALYSSSNQVEFIIGQRIFSTVKDASLASNDVIQKSKEEFEFLAKLYSKHTKRIYILLIGQNAGGQPIKFDDEDEDVQIKEWNDKTKADPGYRTHVAANIFDKFTLINSTSLNDEYEFIKTKMISLYKVIYDQGDIFEGIKPEVCLKRLEITEIENSDNSKNINFDEDGVEIQCVSQLRDHILGDAKIDYENNEPLDIQVDNTIKNYTSNRDVSEKPEEDLIKRSHEEIKETVNKKQNSVMEVESDHEKDKVQVEESSQKEVKVIIKNTEEPNKSWHSSKLSPKHHSKASSKHSSRQSSNHSPKNSPDKDDKKPIEKKKKRDNEENPESNENSDNEAKPTKKLKEKKGKSKKDKVNSSREQSVEENVEEEKHQKIKNKKKDAANKQPKNKSQKSKKDIPKVEEKSHSSEDDPDMTTKEIEGNADRESIKKKIEKPKKEETKKKKKAK